ENTPQGLYTRLRSHASGRRSGDQYFVYVAESLASCILFCRVSRSVRKNLRTVELNCFDRWLHARRASEVGFDAMQAFNCSVSAAQFFRDAYFKIRIES